MRINLGKFSENSPVLAKLDCFHFLEKETERLFKRLETANARPFH